MPRSWFAFVCKGITPIILGTPDNTKKLPKLKTTQRSRPPKYSWPICEFQWIKWPRIIADLGLVGI